MPTVPATPDTAMHHPVAAWLLVCCALLFTAVPVALGAAHQAGALLLFTAALLVNHELLATAGTGHL